MNNLTYYILSALAVLVILTIHEYAHGYAAYKLGDNTAKSLGRLTLNPIKHLDPFGALCMILFHFGWAKPVPINPRNFRNPKRDFAITALAGPLSNILLAFFSSFLYLLLQALFKNTVFESKFIYTVVSNLLLFIYLFHVINIGIGIFNLIPVPPLDGSRILNVVLPPKAYFGIMKYERKIYLGLVLWLVFGTYAANAMLSIPIVRSSAVLSFFAGLLSLSNTLSTIFEAVSNLMMNFWKLIPFLNLR